MIVRLGRLIVSPRKTVQRPFLVVFVVIVITGPWRRPRTRTDPRQLMTVLVIRPVMNRRPKPLAVLGVRFVLLIQLFVLAGTNPPLRQRTHLIRSRLPVLWNWLRLFRVSFLSLVARRRPLLLVLVPLRVMVFITTL